MSKQLVKGQRIKLSDLTPQSQIRLDIALSGLKDHAQFYCLALNEQQKLLKSEYLVFSNQPKSPCQSIQIASATPTQTSINVNLGSLPGEAKEVVLALSLGERTGCLLENASDIQSGSLVVSAGSQEVARYQFSAQDFDGEKALVLGRLYQKDGWRLGLVSSGFRAGQSALFDHFGVPAGLVAPAVPPPPPPQAYGQPAGAAQPAPAPQPPLEDQPILLPGKLPPPKPVYMPASFPGNQAPAVPGGLTGAVGFILVECQDGQHASGTGFVINPGGFILTCYHVVSDAKRMDICLSGTNYLRPLLYVAGSAQHDLALLWISDCNGALNWMPLITPNDDIPLGENIGLLGFPLGFELGINVNYTQGIVNSLRTRNSIPVLQIDAGATHGSSGGPVFRRSDGKVVGMVQAILDQKGILINWALDIRAYWELGWHARF